MWLTPQTTMMWVSRPVVHLQGKVLAGRHLVAQLLLSLQHGCLGSISVAEGLLQLALLQVPRLLRLRLLTHTPSVASGQQTDTVSKSCIPLHGASI